MLKTGTVVRATLVAAPSSTKNSSGERDLEMHQTKKGNHYHFGIKAHIGVDADSGRVHTIIGIEANIDELTIGHSPLHSEESVVFVLAGYQGARKLEEASGAQWHVTMSPGKRRALDRMSPEDDLPGNAERTKHLSMVIKCQFGFTKVRCEGLSKNTAKLITLFAQAKVCMACKQLMGEWG